MENTWGTVCYNSWERMDAEVVCWQLGYTSQGILMSIIIVHLFKIMLILVFVLTGAVVLSSIFGTGSGATYLDEVDCSGGESRLIDCSRSFFVSCSSSRRGAGVRCQGTHMVVIK